MDDNPFASPEHVEDTDAPPEATPPEPTLPAHRTQARRCILFVAVVCGAMSASMLFGFVVNLTSTYPGTDKSVAEVAPLWLAGLPTYGIGFGVLAWCLVRYRAAIGRWDAPESVGGEEFLDVHTRFWRAVAQVLFVFAAYVIISMVFASMDFSSY